MERDFSMDQGNDIRNMGLEEMRRQKVLLASELKAIDAQISDLAFNNYGTYADAGRATHDCSKTFGEMRDKTVDLSSQAEELTSAFQEFRVKAKLLSEEQQLVRKALDMSNPIWELLTLPSRMDICIRAGYYDLAYTLTNYGMQLQQQTQLYKNPLIKKVADRLVEARSYLLEELFNKFAGPLDLAESIKVVNNVRKMPYLTANQLRIAVLQHRDIYLEKQILDISGSSDMIVQAIEIYRTSMYDTLVLYLAVFPENEIVRKDANADPRWESWPVLPPNSILSQWVVSNVRKMLNLITKADVKSAIDISAVWKKLMAMASTFGRMGIDFRPLVMGQLTKLVEGRFRQSVHEETSRLTGSSRDIIMIGIDPASLPQFESSSDSAPVPAAELSLWDDLTVYANAVVEALNGLRFVLTPVILSTVVVSLRESVRSILTWLATSHSNSANFSRAVRIVFTCLVPFFEKCIVFFFPPTVITKIFGSSITKQQYLQFIELDMQRLTAFCDGADKIEEIARPLLQRKTLAEIDLDNVLKAKNAEESEGATFFLEDGQEESEDVTDKRKEATEMEEMDRTTGIDQEKEGENEQKSEIDAGERDESQIETEAPRSEKKREEMSSDKLAMPEETPIIIGTKVAIEPQLESIPEHADVIVPEAKEKPEAAEDFSGEMETAKEEEEGWGWGEDGTGEQEEEVKYPIKKAGKDD